MLSNRPIDHFTLWCGDGVVSSSINGCLVEVWKVWYQQASLSFQ
jgi:hypothetical protein